MGITTRTWVHDEDGTEKVTTVTSQDAAPIIKRAKHLAQNRKDKDFLFLADIPANVINDAAYQASRSWGVSVREAFSELMSPKTDRAKKLWKTLTTGRDFRKFQGKHHR